MLPVRVAAQTPPGWEPGRIIDTVRCLDDPEQTYALYLPRDFSPDRSWPILYVFEPMARGRLPLERLQLSSETHGLILVASNNSRNGSWSGSFNAAAALFDDTWSRFRIDTGRVYTCGFSGGARVATALAINSGRIAGVIACGAGFPTVAEYLPRPDLPFAWVGVVGDRDMNYLEVHQVQEKMDFPQGRAHVIGFAGRHAWPAADTLLLAMDLLQLEALRNGALQEGEAGLDGILKRLRARSENCARQGDVYEAGAFLMRLHRAFPEYFGEEDKTRAQAWLSQKEGLKAAREREKTLKKEAELQQKFGEQFIIDLSYPDDSACARFWKEEGHLLRKMQDHKSPERSRMADRLINQLWVRCYELGARAVENGDYRAGATYYQIWACIQPQSVFAHYEAAKAYARLGKQKFALDHLERAADRGLKDTKKLEVEEFDPVRETRTFKKLYERLQSASTGAGE